MLSKSREHNQGLGPWRAAALVAAACGVSVGAYIVAVKGAYVLQGTGIYEAIEHYLSRDNAPRRPGTITRSYYATPNVSTPKAFDPDPGGPVEQVSPFVVMAFFLLTMHSVVYLMIDWLYRRLGWPPYWADIRGDRLRRRRMARRVWSVSSLKASFALPIWGLSVAIWYSIHVSLLHAPSPTSRALNLGAMVQLLSFLAVPMVHMFIISAQFRDTVRAAIAKDEIRCVVCGYRVAELPRPRCPECGSDVSGASANVFGLKRGLINPSRVLVRAIQLLLVAVLLFAPVLVPLGTGFVTGLFARP